MSDALGKSWPVTFTIVPFGPELGVKVIDGVDSDAAKFMVVRVGKMMSVVSKRVSIIFRLLSKVLTLLRIFSFSSDDASKRLILIRKYHS